MRRRGIAICSALMLAGCAHSSVVLLPEEDGGHGEIALLPKDGKGGETVMKDANSRATLNGAQPSIRPLGASTVRISIEEEQCQTAYARILAGIANALNLAVDEMTPQRREQA